MAKFAPYLKALIAAIVAALSVIGASLADDSALNAQDYVSAAIAFLVALGAVFAVPNTPVNP
jgi:sugar phosphate permease